MDSKGKVFKLIWNKKEKHLKLETHNFSNGMMLMLTKQKKEIILFMDIATIQPPNRL